MLVGALGCNLAWGIIDAVFYLLGCLSEKGRRRVLFDRLRRASTADEAAGVLADALPDPVPEAIGREGLRAAAERLKVLPASNGRPRLSADDWRGALGVFLLVFLSTLPVVLPFVFLSELRPAMRWSNAIAVALLFGCGLLLARYAGLRPMRTALAMVLLGAVLVGLTIALGG